MFIPIAVSKMNLEISDRKMRKFHSFQLKSTIHNEKLSNEIQQMALLNLTQRINDLESPISMDIDLFAKNLVEAALNEASDQ